MVTCHNNFDNKNDGKDLHMITNYSGIKKAQENTKEIDAKYKAMLEYGLDKDEPLKKPQVNSAGLLASVILVILFAVFVFFEFVSLFFLH